MSGYVTYRSSWPAGKYLIVHNDLEFISLRRALWKTQVLSSITMEISNLASLVIIYMTPCSLVASQKYSDEVLPPSSGRRTARSTFLKHQTARRHLPAYSNSYSNRDDMAWNKQTERCRLFVYGHNTVVTSCVS